MAPRRSVGERRRDEIEAWWALFVRILLTLLGVLILAHQTFVADHAQWLLVAAGVGLCGRTVALSVATVLRAIRGGPPE